MKKDLSPDNVLLMLAMLEHYMHRRYIGEYQVSPTFDPNDTYSLHKEASKMLLFAGLMTYHPLVEFTDIGNNTAGDIHLNDNLADFTLHIRLSSSSKQNQEKVLCILAHEVCHKVLQFYKFPILKGLDNEYYTDVATFYVGFGKLTLNGARTTEHIPNGTRTNYIGYLSDIALFNVNNIVNLIYNHNYSNSYGNVSRSVSNETYNYLQKLSEMPEVRDSNGNIVYFEKYFRIVCPYCGFVSRTFSPQLFQKIIKCPKCKSTFKNQNSISYNNYKYQPSVERLSIFDIIVNFISTKVDPLIDILKAKYLSNIKKILSKI